MTAMPSPTRCDRGARNVLLELLRLLVHLVADDRPGRTADHGADDRAARGRTGLVADHAADRTARRRRR